ncbi:DNA-directed RNA polymerase, subunit E' [Methanocella conradii HZ254]|uniref:DNA-directed RNA polymerase subunit Rpo7 n=1 Tax=Methanocella conradii (strain DSM 24694 / JCM 17849 / CGMCC 1.5162 / HZ254) TaxID=1041930 RepID=H8I5E0_METCZ|nr:DNA-directed RNA polymerase [Methanocella conradii]AFC98834.1 DNA-directed RNA polymerase, subunit E' [Methanocella conradii HZ254]
MYRKVRLVDIIRIPPQRLEEDLEQVINETIRDKLEGRIDKALGSIVAVLDIVDIGEGHILIGDGAVYYEVTFDAIAYRPELQEIVEGVVVEIVAFGAFVSVGPIDCLVHVSQVADEFMSYDEKNARLVSKETNKSLAEGDKVRARIVAVSLNEHNPRESKIGLTMRQVALGKLEWIEEEQRRKERGEKPEKARA